MMHKKNLKDRDLFQVSKTNFNKKYSKKKKFKKQKVQDLDLSKENEIQIEALTYENISEGQIILGCILEIRKYELLISLPHRMIGNAPITSISSSYKQIISKISEGESIDCSLYNLEDLYSVGDILVCKVKSVVSIENDKLKIILSITPEDVNSELFSSNLKKGSVIQAAVSNVEDNGFILETGIKNVRAAFIPKNDVIKGKDVGVGSVFICTVKHVLAFGDEMDQLRIKVSPEIGVMVPVDDEGYTENVDNIKSHVTIVPGILVKATVKKIMIKGIRLWTGRYNAFVSVDHLAGIEDNLSNYIEGQEVTARVLYIKSLSNVLHCTINQNICSQSCIKETLAGMKVGDIVENARIFKSGKFGVYLELPNACCGFCSANKLQDSAIHEDKIIKNFAVDSTRSCRIIHCNLMDQLFIVSLQKSIVAEKIFGTEDLEVGQRLKVKIIEHTSAGAAVSISPTVHGFVPTLHLTDKLAKSPEVKIPVGQTFFGRILKHVPGEKPHITLKSQLVKTDSEIIQEFDLSNLKKATLGTIVNVYDGGLLIEFFNAVRGFMPKSKMPISMKKKYPDSFSKGDIIECKIEAVRVEKSEMTLAPIFEQDSDKDTLTIRKRVDCKIVSKNKDDVLVSILGYSDQNSFITKTQLSDNVEYATTIFNLIQEGDVFRDAFVIKIEKGAVYLSIKHIFYRFLDDCTGNISKNELFPVYVTELLHKDLRVSSIKGYKGGNAQINHKRIVAEELTRIWYTGIEVGQTLIAKCLGFKKEGWPILSTKFEDTLVNKEKESFELLYSTIKTEYLIKDLLFRLNSKFKVKIGGKYNGRVKAVAKFGILVYVPSLHMDGVIPIEHCNPTGRLAIGESLKVKVLNFNAKDLSLDLSAKLSLKKIVNECDPAIKIGDEYLAEILLTKKEYILARLKKKHIGTLVFLPSKRHCNDFRGRHYYYKIGNKCKIVIKFIEGNLIMADLLAHHWNYRSSKECAIDIKTKLPTVTFDDSTASKSQKAKEGKLVSKLVSLDKNLYTSRDFFNLAHDKISKLVQYVDVSNTIRKRNAFTFSMLKKDDFSQFDELGRRALIRGATEQNKKLKKLTGDGRIKLKNDEENEKKINSKKCDTDKEVKNKKRKLEITKESNKKCKLDTKVSRKQKNKSDENSENRKVKPITIPMENVPTIFETAVSSGDNCLNVETNGFDWTGEAAAPRDDSETDSEVEDILDQKEKKSVSKLSKAERLKARKLGETKTRSLELERVDEGRRADTALDFEEKIQKSPNSSAVWIEYVSFQLENAETERAREVASRALKIIPPAREVDRLAIWNVILRLEVMYGSPDSVQSNLKEALVTNDQLKIFFMMLSIYESTNKFKEAEDIIKTMTKKYSQNSEVWIKSGMFFYQTKRLNEARNTLDRSLLSLSKEDHVNVINRFAQFEMKFGESERSRTIFESLLSNFSSRLDIWNVYADLLIKRNDVDAARDVLERMTNLKLRANSMRTVFKKLLQFEKLHGTPQRVESVKNRVQEYVENALKD